MNQPHGDSRVHRLASTVVSVAAFASLGMISGCAADQDAASVPTRDSAATPDPTAEHALEQTALAVAEAFADRDRGEEERTEEWLSQLRGHFEIAAGVKVGNGQAADDGLVLLTHVATSTHKCIAVTEAADVAGEPVEIARISTGQPRC